jgi:hypothetical protein
LIAGAGRRSTQGLAIRLAAARSGVRRPRGS